MSTDEQQRRERPIRSFVRRQGRFTPAQRDAFDSLWAGRGLEPGDAPLDLPSLFPGCTAFVVEIGFGMGHTLVELASRSPQTGFVGIEVHRPGVGKLLAMAEERGLQNVRVFCHDAVEVLNRAIPDASLDGLLLFFPDPWHKKRHHKRRLVQPPFVELVQRKLKPGGLFHLATDWEDYGAADARGGRVRARLGQSRRRGSLLAAAGIASADALRAARHAPRARGVGPAVQANSPSTALR